MRTDTKVFTFFGCIIAIGLIVYSLPPIISSLLCGTILTLTFILSCLWDRAYQGWSSVNNNLWMAMPTFLLAAILSLCVMFGLGTTLAATFFLMLPLWVFAVTMSLGTIIIRMFDVDKSLNIEMNNRHHGKPNWYFHLAYAAIFTCSTWFLWNMITAFKK